MRCEKCGADIGEKKVCPFCSTPIKNVLVEMGLSARQSNDSEIKMTGYIDDMEDVDQTSVMTSPYIDCMDTGIIVSDALSSETKGNEVGLKKVEEVSAKFKDKQGKKKKRKKIKSNGKTEADEKPLSVIPDFEIVEKENKTTKQKIIIACVIVFVCLLLVMCVIGCVSVKKYKKYVSGLKDLNVMVCEETEAVDNRMFEWEAAVDCLIVRNVKSQQIIEIETPLYDTFVTSSCGNYGAFRTVSSYEVWVEDRSDEGKHKETIYVYELYIVTHYGEKIKVFNVEKQVGEILLLGVTDDGGVVYTDTEQHVSNCVSRKNNISFDVEIQSLLIYQDELFVFTDINNQLVIKKEGQGDEIEDQIISSSVEQLYYLDSKGDYGLLKELRGIVSTDSISRTLAYKCNNRIFKINLYDEDNDSLPFSEEALIVDDKTYMTSDLVVVEPGKVNLNGKGKLSINAENKLCYQQGLYKRKLVLCDEIVALVGTKAYYMYDSKMYEIDVFTKKNKEISDHKMKVILEKQVE